MDSSGCVCVHVCVCVCKYVCAYVSAWAPWWSQGWNQQKARHNELSISTTECHFIP